VFIAALIAGFYNAVNSQLKESNPMKLITMTLITVQSFLTPGKMRLAMFALALVAGRAIPGLDDFNHGGCGGG
jgi:hypothetical protein